MIFEVCLIVPFSFLNQILLVNISNLICIYIPQIIDHFSLSFLVAIEIGSLCYFLDSFLILFS